MIRPVWWLLVAYTAVASMACAPENARGPRPEDELTVKVETENWDATRLRVYCDGSELAVLRDLAIGQASTGRVRLGVCQDVVVVAEGISGDSWQSTPILVQTADTLLVHLMADLPQSWFALRDREER